MRTKFKLMITFLVMLWLQFSFAQQRTVSGVVSDEKGMPLAGVSVQVKNTKNGTQTDFDGKYNISAAAKDVLVFSFVGMQAKEVVASSASLNVSLQEDATQLQEVVVTALGIKRDKKSLGYASQQVSAESLKGGAPTQNITNLLAGKAAGVEIRRNNNFGGSTNIIMRGNKSLTGNNQALWVIDGVPIDNGNSNSSAQQQGRGGYYDYGNAASDINQEDIESINILKGAAATALYGSRAANGVVLVTTKKGKSNSDSKIGVTVNSGYSYGKFDKDTFAKYQDKYGAGYGLYYEDPSGYFLYRDIDGNGTDDLVVPTSEDASYGAPFDTNLMVYHWDSFSPYSPNFNKKYAWTAAKNGPSTFFETANTFSNSVSLESSNDKASFLATYSKLDQTGILPNSQLVRDQISTRFNYKITEKLSANAYSSITLQKTKGRNSTGYNDNIMSMFRQWWQTNVDLDMLKHVYNNSGGQNVTWNWSDPSDLVPIYWDNPYFTRYKNYSSDNRFRFIGYVSFDYKFNNWLSALGRISLDSNNELQEERRAVGSIAATFGLSPVDETSGYQRFTKDLKEFNYDLMLNFNKDLTEELNVAGVVGFNYRRKKVDNVLSSTIGGLVQPGYYALSNSFGELPFPIETKYPWVNTGIYAQASLGYKDTYYIEGSIRRDASSTLEVDRSYVYPAISTSMIFSNLIGQSWLNFGKLRLNYAEVGNDATPLSTVDTFVRNTNFHGNPVFTLPNVIANYNLKPERTKSFEIGIETSMFNKRVGFDVSYYNSTSIDQIVSGAVSSASSVTSAVVNGGEILNKGVELQLNVTPFKNDSFEWSANINWSKNKNEVVALPAGLENLQLGSFQGGVSINATPGEPYGTIKGTDNVYHANGQPIVSQSTGRYLVTTASDKIIGNINPDWIGGIRNTLRYKNVSMSFLIDMQKGGDIFSLDMSYGLATGLYPETAVNDIRNTGVILPGVAPDGSPNTKYTVSPQYFGNNYGYRRAANKQFIYDASFVKLREVSINYNVPRKLIEKTFLSEVVVSLNGTNLWIIDKNLPYADPESGLSSGNLSRGYSIGSLPTTREIGFNVKFKF